MKKNIVSFMAAMLIMAASAFAQQKPRYTSPVWKAELIKNLQGYVDPSLAVKAKAVIDDYYTLDATKKLAWNKKNTLVDSMEVASAQLGRLNGTKMIAVDTNSTLKIRFLKLEKLFGSEYDSLLFPAYVFQGLKDMDEYNHDLVYSYDLNGDGTNDARSAREGRKDNVIQNLATPVIAGHEDASAEETTAPSNKKTSQPAPASTDFSEEEEVDIELPSEPEASANEDEAKYTIGSDGKKYRLVPVEEEVEEPSASTTTGKRKAVRTHIETEEVELQGDQDLFAQAKDQPQGTQQQQSGLPSGLYELDPAKSYYQYDSIQKKLVLLQEADLPPQVLQPGKNGVIVSGDGKEILRNSNKVALAQTKRYYGADGYPTTASEIEASKVAGAGIFGSNGGWRGFSLFTGMTIGQTYTFDNIGECRWDGAQWNVCARRARRSGHMSNSLIGGGNIPVSGWAGVGGAPGQLSNTARGGGR